ncbi:MAG: ATP-dependent Clp protease proteolytic subunit [Planctomycetota bacterium]|nr:ATP-dependent Clp protease proteolytic subunit [Planctomycetota bacterium]
MADTDKKATRGLRDKLLEQRIVLLSEPVMPEASERLVSQFLYLNAKDKKAPIQFWINTPGGSVSDGFAIYDTIRFIEAPVSTVCTGMSASMGTILMLAPRDKKHRVCLPNTRIMIHQPSGGAQGQASDIEISAREILKLRDRLISIYVSEAGIDEEKVRGDMNRDHWLTAQEAVEYGLCDRIVQNAGDL